MSTGLREDQSRVDPDKWKPLVRLAPAILIAVMLGWLESMMIPGILRGYKRDLFQACLFGLALLFLLYAILVGIWKWWHRPVGEQAILQAASQVARILPDKPLVCRLQKSPAPNKAIYAALPLTFLGISICGIFLGNWVVCFAPLAAAVISGGLFWYVLTEAKETREVVLSFDPTRKVIIFENFGFVTAFLPQKPRPREEVPFEEILDCTFYPGQKGGPPSLGIKTARGPTTINGRMEHFDVIRTLLESMVTLNLADPEQHQTYLRAMPTVKVPWYGWLIVVGAFGALGVLIWALLTKL